MKVFVAFMLFSVSQLVDNSFAALPNVGVCTFRELTNMERSCNTIFFQSFRSDPHEACSTKFTVLYDCYIAAIQRCRTTWSKSQASDALKALNINEKRYCEDAGLQDPALYPNRNRVPCSSIYFQKAYGCANETLKLFRSNKADPRLCSVYAKAIKCEKTLIDTECWYTGVAKEVMDAMYDGYNPFCEPLTPTEKNAVASNLSRVSVAFLILSVLVSSAFMRY